MAKLVGTVHGTKQARFFLELFTVALVSKMERLLVKVLSSRETMKDR